VTSAGDFLDSAGVCIPLNVTAFITPPIEMEKYFVPDASLSVQKHLLNQNKQFIKAPASRIRKVGA